MALGGKREGSGRKKGTLNKPTQDLFDICSKHNVNVFEAMIMLTANEQDPTKKFERLAKVAPYLYPQRKAVEMNATVTNNEEHQKEIDRYAEMLAKAKG